METGLNKIVEVRGLSRKNGVLAITMGTSLMAIAGIPPLVGFMNKFLVIKSVVESQLIGIAIIAVILSVVSAFYYVRIIR
jgi:NADH-quinone oxidoreductase subunit N